tara:strand:+ start:307 stop:1050 length:744 start_codon:yes stop_codon:yes gene_type:complete
MFNLSRIFQNMPPIVKNLLLVNVIFFVAQFTLEDFMRNLELVPIFSEHFRPWQLATYFFMHGNLPHIFFNMFALIIFGTQLERVWGPQKFLFFYLACAIGAALIHMLVGYLRLKSFESTIDPIILNEYLNIVQDKGYELILNSQNFAHPILGKLNSLYNTPMVGASGAIFGLLVAFGYIFPNTELMLLFPPIPIKAKYFVIGYAAIELYLGMANSPSDNVAHFAHLGGALIGILIVLYWKKSRNSFF